MHRVTDTRYPPGSRVHDYPGTRSAAGYSTTRVPARQPGTRVLGTMLKQIVVTDTRLPARQPVPDYPGTRLPARQPGTQIPGIPSK